MSTFRPVTKTCFMCGKTSEQYVMTSTSAFGSMDLDTRPPALERYTNANRVQVCPHCGYANYTIDTKTTVTPDFLKTEAYLAVRNNEMPEVAKNFLCHALIANLESKVSNEFWAYLRAAWECDDREDTKSAVMCRLCALRVLSEAPPSQIMQNVDSTAIMEADLLRRTGQFDTVIGRFEKYRSDNDFLQKLIRYEVRLAQQKDDACHSVDEC